MFQIGNSASGMIGHARHRLEDAPSPVAVCDHRNMARAAEQDTSSRRRSASASRSSRPTSHAAFAALAARRRADPGRDQRCSARAHGAVHDGPDRERCRSFNSGRQGRVRLVATVSAIAESLLDDIASFMREPAIATSGRRRGALLDELVRHLREGGRGGRRGLGSRRSARPRAPALSHDRLALAVHPDHPLAGRKSLRFEQTLTTSMSACIRPARSTSCCSARRPASAGSCPTGRVSNFDAASGSSREPRHQCDPGRGVRAGRLDARHKVIPAHRRVALRRFAVCFQTYAALQPPARRLVDHLVERAAAAGPP